MSEKKKAENFVRYKTEDMLHAAESLISASSIIVAATDQYVHTGSLSVGAVLHAGMVVDAVIERLGLSELEIEQKSLPF